MRILLFAALMLLVNQRVIAQAPPVTTSADIFLQLKKLQVLGSVLYVAAHPDDENTRLLAWLSKEKLYRTGYLSITRGDGGQNLIGDEQGIDLGLIRTQELLAARRTDGAEQFFTRAFDFGFSKSTAEAFAKWNKEKILGDVVWMIRKFQPDIIITRFPEDARAGHGHHSGSAVLAHEAFSAAADPKRYPEQFAFGVQPWQAKRIVWNTFNFGTTNTTSEDQLKVDVGGYNPILGKSYGEIAAESRSQHKSQGFGVPASRGAAFEYFVPTEGVAAKTDLMDDVITNWSRIPGGDAISKQIEDLIRSYSLSDPQAIVPGLGKLYKSMQALPAGNWKKKKLMEVQQLIEMCSGLWLEASTSSEYAVQGDSLRIIIAANNRLGSPLQLEKFAVEKLIDTTVHQTLDKNKNYIYPKAILVDPSREISQPYWMVDKMVDGSFTVNDQKLIGLPQSPASYSVNFRVTMAGDTFDFEKPVMYKSTDPVKGELYQPLVVVPSVAVSTDPSILIFRKKDIQKQDIAVKVTAHRNLLNYAAHITGRMATTAQHQNDSSFSLMKGLNKEYYFTISNDLLKETSQDFVQAYVEMQKGKEEQQAYNNITSLRYDHIPHIHYFYQDAIKVLNIDLKTAGKKIGYIEGAGDKVSIALKQMGYEVTILKEKDITTSYIAQFDAIITGVRAYNVNDYMAEKYDILMNYVKEGGNLIVQYNTNNFISNVKSKIGPYPLTISRNRVTDEKAKVNFLIPDHPVLNYPNKITDADFDGWIQERGIYYADPIDANYVTPLSMADPDEPAQKGALVIADYGKGKFVYTGLVFFRELPAGVPGAYRLLANIIALNRKKAF